MTAITESLWLDALHTSGFRTTAPMKAVISVLVSASAPVTPVDIFVQSRHDCPSIGLVTVYRTLEKLEQLGLIQRIHLSSGCHSYIPAFVGHQHILVCDHCGRIEYFSGDDLDGLIAATSLQYDFKISSHWLQLIGTCSHCQAQNPENAHA